MANTALNRTTVALLTNKSGGAVAQGDVVIVDSANAAAFTTTTTSAYVSGSVGVVLEPNGIASNAIGSVAFAGYVPVINLSSSASLGDVFHTHTVAKQALRHAAPVVAGDFGQVIGTGTTPAAFLWSQPTVSGGGGSSTLAGDSDVSISSPASGQALIYNGSAWSNKVPPGAELGYVSATSAFTTSATGATDITSMTLTVTVGASPIILEFYCYDVFAATITDGVELLLVDMTAGATIQILEIAHDAVGSGGYVRRRYSPGAGSRTFKMQVNHYSGTSLVTVGAGATFPMEFQILST